MSEIGPWYAYHVAWSAQDGEYAATVDEAPSLSWLDEDPVEALKGLVKLLVDEEFLNEWVRGE